MPKDYLLLQFCTRECAESDEGHGRVQHDDQMSTYYTDPELISPDRPETSGQLLT